MFQSIKKACKEKSWNVPNPLKKALTPIGYYNIIHCIPGFGMNLNIAERLKKTDWKVLAIVLLIFLLAFGIRAYLLRYELMFEFDTYWHTRMTGEIVQHGAPPAIDPLAYYQLKGGSPTPLETQLFWYASAFFYFVAAFFTTGGLVYNKQLLIEVVKILPAFYGAIVCVGLYLIGKEAYGKRAGYLMGFFGAVSSSFIYRSMAGFYEAGTFGYVLIVFGFYFVLRAAKRMHHNQSMLLNGAIAGILLGLTAHAYGLFITIPLILIFYLIFTSLGFLQRNQVAEAIRFVKLVGGIFLLFFIIALTSPNSNWFVDIFALVLDRTNKIPFLLPLIALIGIVIVGAVIFFLIRKGSQTSRQPHSTVSTNRNVFSWIKILFLYLILVGLLFLMLTPQTRTGIQAISVGEESPGHLYFFHKFSILMVFPVLAMLLAPFIDFRKKETDLASMLFFPFILISFYMAWDRLHYSYNLGVPLAIAAAYVVFFAFQALQHRPKSEKMLVGVLAGFMILAGVASATLFTQNNTPTIEVDTGWKEGLKWLKDNTPTGTKVFNWWDEGHWITFLGERKVITDNRNFDGYSNSDVGKFVLTTDLNEAIRILKKYDSDYITLGADLLSKRNSMALYAHYFDVGYDPRKDPDMDPVQSLDAPCSQQEKEGVVTGYQCGGAQLNIQQMNSIPSAWTDKPSNIENGRDAVFYYRTVDNAHIFKLSLKENQTIFAKMWFHAPDVAPFFEEVFPDDLPQYKNKELKIFKVQKEKFPTSG